MVLLLATGAARAQFVQYTAPGSLAEEQIPTKERLEASMEASRRHLGPLRFGLWLALKDAAYLNNVNATATDPTSDFTATLGAGAQGYLPLGSHLTLGMYAMPEYVWWRQLANRRGWNGATGAGFFGYFNRMTVEIQAGASRRQQYPSSEVEVPATLEDRHISALVEVKVFGAMSIFGRGGVDRWLYLQRGLSPDLASELGLLDRDEKRAGGGVRLHFTRSISLGLGVEQFATDFAHPDNPNSNSGLAPIAELDLKAGRLRVGVRAFRLNLKPRGTSQFVPYDDTDGSFRLGLKPAGKVELQYYGGRNLVYSVTPGTPYYIDERTGFGLQTRLGSRATGQIFLENGRNRYVAERAGSVPRSDDFKTYGARVNAQIGRWATLVLGADRTDFTSTSAVYDRSITRIETSLHLATGKAQWW